MRVNAAMFVTDQTQIGEKTSFLFKRLIEDVHEHHQEDSLKVFDRSKPPSEFLSVENFLIFWYDVLIRGIRVLLLFLEAFLIKIVRKKLKDFSGNDRVVVDEISPVGVSVELSFDSSFVVVVDLTELCPVTRQHMLRVIWSFQEVGKDLLLNVRIWLDELKESKEVVFDKKQFRCEPYFSSRSLLQVLSIAVLRFL